MGVRISEFDIFRRAKEFSKTVAGNIEPDSGTTTRFNQYFVIAAASAVREKKSEKDSVIKANSERYAKKYADEINAPLIAEKNELINGIKNITRNHVNGTVDKRIQHIQDLRLVPISDKDWRHLQTIETMINSGIEIPESDWKLWGEMFAGKYWAERHFAALAEKRNITIVPVSNYERSIENLETFRQMANIAIDYLDHPEDSITAQSFLSTNNKNLNQLMDEIDSDYASIIPAEKLTVIKRLKQAEKNAYDKDAVELSVKIKSFRERNEEKLSTPEELTEALFSEAEGLIEKGMTAKKGDK